ncbi:MAG: hypothetical protein ACP5UO_03355 [Thermoplasmata archaeon]
MILKEGSVSVEILSYYERGPGARSPGFFNREMQVSRDLTVALLSSLPRGKAIDPMAGTGVRGIRIAKEAGWSVVINDLDGRNASLARRNAEMNSVQCDVLNEDYYCALSRGRWDYVDIDPFGSPAGFIDAALMRLKNHGIIGVTMTDTSNLEGASIEKGERIYLSRGIRGVFGREVSTRAFISFLVRKGAALGMGGKPLLAVREGHYIRAFIRYSRGAVEATEALRNLRVVDINGETVGPLYMGRIYDSELIERMKNFNFSERTSRLFQNFFYEDLMFLFFLNRVGQREVRKEKVVNALRGAGFLAGPTNFSPNGIKSNASAQDFERITSSI